MTAAVADELNRRAERRRAIEGEIEIAPDEVSAVGLFIALATQWRWHAMAAVRSGLDYGVVREVAGMMEIAVDSRLFGDLRVMEAAALAAWAEQ